ncbi:MAG: hypothetical protein OEZ36_05855, partial [Spirochaetota bacterium]|nr:hypothetical protein [Spirochaetota bacterium]
MIRKSTKSLVIDADIAFSAGDKKAHPVSTRCRKFLETFRKMGHKLLLTKPITEEWVKHESPFSLTWRRNMVAKKQVDIVSDYREDRDLRKAIYSLSLSDNKIEAMLKDAHLVESCLLRDKTVISNEKVVRKLFADSTEQIPELQEIVWVNPTIQAESPIEWLEAGAPPEDQ